jgi:hypothetical protein
VEDFRLYPRHEGLANPHFARCHLRPAHHQFHSRTRPSSSAPRALITYVGSVINQIMSDGFALLLSWPTFAVVSTLSDGRRESSGPEGANEWTSLWVELRIAASSSTIERRERIRRAAGPRNSSTTTSGPDRASGIACGPDQLRRCHVYFDILLAIILFDSEIFDQIDPRQRERSRDCHLLYRGVPRGLLQLS